MKLSFRDEPTVWISLIRSVLLLVVLFGVMLTDVQIAGILLVAESFFATINRQQVVPMSPSMGSTRIQQDPKG